MSVEAAKAITQRQSILDNYDALIIGLKMEKIAILLKIGFIDRTNLD